MKKILYLFHPLLLTPYYLIGCKLHERRLINKIQKSKSKKIEILNEIEILNSKIKS